MKVLCTICARGGSKGIHKKNLRRIAGKLLIAHTIELAARLKLFDAVVFSSDCSDLMEVARTYGANVFFKRDKSISSDNAGKIPVIQDVYRRSCEYFKTSFDVHFDLDCTSPLRIENDLINAFNLFTKTDSDLTISGTKSRKSPYFNIVEVEEDGLNYPKNRMIILCLGSRVRNVLISMPHFIFGKVCSFWSPQS